MFNKKKQPPIKSLIAEGSQIDGTLTFSDGLRIDGKVIGDVNANNDQSSILVISETASVVGLCPPDAGAAAQSEY
jgi:cytoskeletal protein CcmA (bactofilin family)